jgi:UbiD family decarboxylase
MAYGDLRDYLEELEKRGKLKHVKAEVDITWEVACIARWVFQAVPEKERYGLRFDHPKGFDIPIVTGVCGASREIYAIALGTTADHIFEKWYEGLKKLIPPKEVKVGPVHEVVEEGDDVDLYKIPIPTWTPGKDGGPYLTAPCVITKDPDTGLQNVGTYRVQIQTGNRTGVLITTHKDIGIHFYNKYESKEKAMPVAVAFGVDPSIGLASLTRVPYGVDELAVAGGLRGSPVETVRGITVDLQVPARAEYVIEGEVLPHVREKEGPFGETLGYQTVPGLRTCIQVKCITHRKKPIYQGYTSQFPPSESTMMRGQSYAAIFYNRLVHDLGEQSIRDVYLTESSSSNSHILISMKPLYSGHAKRIGLLAANLMPPTGKIVTVVDDDIDIRDPFAVDWALCYRVNPAMDITIIERDNLQSLDPSNLPQRVGMPDPKPVPFEERLSGSKMVIDATVKATYPDISLPPKDLMDRVFERWESFGLPAIKLPERLKLLLEKHPVQVDYFTPFR